MKQRKKAGIFLLVFLFWTGGIALHTHGKSKETIIEFGMFVGSNWGVENSNSYIIIDQAIRKFEAEHDNVKVHYYSGVLKDDYSEWLSRKLLEDEMPDVFMVLNEDFNLFSSMGVLKDLEALMEEDASLDPDIFYQTALDTGVFQGHQYALPYETVPTMMFVNKTLLEQEGIGMPDIDWTWEDLYEICSRITRDTDGDGVIDRFGIYGYSWQEAAYSNGDAPFDMEGQESYFAGEKMVEAIRFASRIEELSGGQKVTQEDFDNGNVAFMPTTFAQYRTYSTYPYKTRKYKEFQWDCITFPSEESGKNRSVVDTLLMGISNRTRHQSLAWEFLKTLTCDREIQMELLRYSQAASVLKSVTNSEEAEKVALYGEVDSGQLVNAQLLNAQLLSGLIENGTVAPKFPKYEQALSLAENEISKMFEENKDIESGLKKIQRTINAYLQE